MPVNDFRGNYETSSGFVSDASGSFVMSRDIKITPLKSKLQLSVDDEGEYDPTAQIASNEFPGYTPSRVEGLRGPAMHVSEDMDDGDDEADAEVEELQRNVYDVVEDDGWRCRSGTPDLDELRANAARARVERDEWRRMERESKAKLDGVGALLQQLKDEAKGIVKVSEDRKDRIVLGFDGRVVPKPRKLCRGPTSAPLDPQGMMVDVDLPPGPPHPTDPEEIRRLVRSKMVKCKVCRNRFGERHILERHLRDFHYVEYLEHIAQQEEEIQLQKLEEQELNRIEELTSGGFIPPEEELAASNFDVDIKRIPLPGELSNGIPARFDKNGVLRQPKRPYKKKVSPQCPFCDKRFRNEVSLKKHIQKKHEECQEFQQCLLCFKCLATADELPEDKHLCELSYMCFECSPMRNLCTAQRLLLHRAKFHRGANSGFRCNDCNMKFLTPRKLRKHKKMAHVFTKTYPCHFCEELFTSEVSVVTHERMHTGIIKFECLICDYRCNRYVEMEAHKKEEHGYLCSICKQPFAEWSEIKNHTLIEHGGYLTNENSAGYIESPRVWVMYKGE